ncbi:acyl-CoA dehydrogenase family protein [Deminuibacter soli]|uniref:Acyl-CoA dehydrogenase n=1 Tax=Deminuibacter soli TaxID=2291815 RepID=A0A3E1NR45_9BACT|nr:acyl-CoA dehydrogenase [Deminuibacter soli]RFM30393.1 acyl-CoA dehydrogenase [Deminuibacter soli]
MSAIKHPSEIVQTDWINILRSEAARAEQLKQLTPVQVALLHRQRWFTLLTPKQYGGLEWSLPAVVRFEEAIAWADGSVAWVLTLCTGAGWFGGFLQPALAQTLFADPAVCFAGSGAQAGTAAITAEGYIINGQWLHASGAPHATVFTANCTITRNGVPLTGSDGNPVIKPFVLLPGEVELLPTWKSFGLVATASNAFKATNVTVTRDRCFEINQARAVDPSPLYQYPFLQLAEATLAANISGMSLHFTEAAQQLLQQTQKPGTMAIAGPLLQQAQHTIQTLRTAFYKALDESWQQQLQGSITAAALQAVSETSRKLAQESRRTADELYPYCGLQAAATDTEINRIWRDLHTASQHGLLIYPRG